MRFAGCCNISCKRIDAVEHSDDLGASRKGRNLPTSEKQSTLEKIASPLRRGSKKIQQSNAPGPKDLDALACRLAERVRPRLAKTDGGQTYVSQSVPHPELMEALQDEGLDESSAEGALVAMRDVEIMRRVATGPRAKDDLYRFNDAVLPATMRIILSTVRFPDEGQGHRKALSRRGPRRLPVLDEVQARRRVARGPHARRRAVGRGRRRRP